jgi:hypothetical protein
MKMRENTLLFQGRDWFRNLIISKSGMDIAKAAASIIAVPINTCETNETMPCIR